MIELVIRVVVSLALVLGLLWLVARASQRRFGGAARSMVRVIARQSLARNSALAVVEVGERVLVVGVGEQGVSLLTELDPDEVPEPVAGSADPASSEASAARAARRAGFRLVKGPSDPGHAVAASVTRVAPGAHAAARPAGLNGSVLSTTTWKQAWAAATSRNGAGGD